jgi:Ca2+/Na+ antiporter
MAKNTDENQRRNKLILLLVGMFIVFVVFRQTYQQGQKLLANVHPWDWIALVVIFAVLFYYLYKYSREGIGKDEKS